MKKVLYAFLIISVLISCSEDSSPVSPSTECLLTGISTNDGVVSGLIYSTNGILKQSINYSTRDGKLYTSTADIILEDNENEFNMYLDFDDELQQSQFGRFFRDIESRYILEGNNLRVEYYTEDSRGNSRYLSRYQDYEKENGRIVSKKYYDDFEGNGIEFIEGSSAYYTYDNRGRLISEVSFDSTSVIEYEYSQDLINPEHFYFSNWLPEKFHFHQKSQASKMTIYQYTRNFSNELELEYTQVSNLGITSDGNRVLSIEYEEGFTTYFTYDCD